MAPQRGSGRIFKSVDLGCQELMNATKQHVGS